MLIQCYTHLSSNPSINIAFIRLIFHPKQILLRYTNACFCYAHAFFILEKQMNQYWKVFIKGLAMGAADVVPGVSGGTLAFILGVYERLLNALASFNIHAIKLTCSGQFKQTWRYIDGTFLLYLFAGILVSIFSLTKGISYMLEHQPVPLWAFFNGLIFASLPILIRHVSWTWQRSLLFLVGMVSATLITLLTPMQS